MEKYILYIVLAVIAFVIIYILKTKNSIVSCREEVEQSKSRIEIYLTERYDTLVKLNKVINSYTKHEYNVLKDVTKIRKGMSGSELSEANEQMEEVFSKISAVVENHPDLKAGINFMHFQETIYDIEENLAATRRIYNQDVKVLNNYIIRMPSCFVASLFHEKKEEYFKAEDRKKNDVELEF